MNADEEFVETLICPACRSKVVLKEDGSAVKCTSCRRAYPVANGIPAMVVEESVVEDEGTPNTA